MKNTFDIQATFNALMKGAEASSPVETIQEKVIEVAKQKRVLNVKLGLDPSAPDVHLGHAVVLRKIKQLQDLGHRATLIIGDFTGMIGDPTGKSKTRKPLSKEQVLANAQTYKDQIFKIIKREQTDLRFNSEWLGKISANDFVKLCATTTIARILERDDFSKRFNNHEPISVHELLYPLLQAYDSHAIKADVELGGTDQTFNILMGRNIQKAYGSEQQVAVFTPLLRGLDGVEKMSKSLGNYIGINEDANDMFEKVMKIPDSLIIEYFTLATDMPQNEINKIEELLRNGKTNPRDIKMMLAQEICSLYHDKKSVEIAKEHFVSIYQKKEAPKDIETIKCTREDFTQGGKINIVDVIFRSGKFKSKGEIKRLISSGAVKLNDEKISDFEVSVSDKMILQVGKGIMFQIEK